MRDHILDCLKNVFCGFSQFSLFLFVYLRREDVQDDAEEALSAKDCGKYASLFCFVSITTVDLINLGTSKYLLLSSEENPRTKPAIKKQFH